MPLRPLPHACMSVCDVARLAIEEQPSPVFDVEMPWCLQRSLPTTLQSFAHHFLGRGRSGFQRACAQSTVPGAEKLMQEARDA